MPLTGKPENDGSVSMPVVSILLEHAEEINQIMASGAALKASIEFGELWQAQEREQQVRSQLAQLAQHPDPKSSSSTPGVQPEPHILWNDLGEVLVHQGSSRSDEALGAFDNALQLQPAYAPALKGIGLLLEERG